MPFTGLVHHGSSVIRTVIVKIIINNFWLLRCLLLICFRNIYSRWSTQKKNFELRNFKLKNFYFFICQTIYCLINILKSCPTNPMSFYIFSFFFNYSSFHPYLLLCYSLYTSSSFQPLLLYEFLFPCLSVRFSNISSSLCQLSTKVYLIMKFVPT